MLPSLSRRLMLKKKSFFAIALILLVYSTLPEATAYFNYEKLAEEPWDHSPITVFIDTENTPPHYSPTYLEQIEKALAYWEAGGNGKLAYSPIFEIVDSEKADIRIRWVENMESVEGAEAGVAGYASPHLNNGKFTYVEIVLEVGNPRGKGWHQYGDKTMFKISKHEMGHALGLGHSNDRRDIMYKEFELREDVNPLLVSKYGTLIKLGSFAIFVFLLSLGVSLKRSRKKRKALEEKYFK
ncbi:MAG: matrixin family metalloprotease [Methanosarcinaceae archaeon]|nr:matrixin family metalloprotease [Methanosarcinaceae archaeon]